MSMMSPRSTGSTEGKSMSLTISLGPTHTPSSVCSLDLDNLVPRVEKEIENEDFTGTCAFPETRESASDDVLSLLGHFEEEEEDLLWALEEPALPPKAVVRTGLIRNLDQLLDSVEPGSFVAFDIDDTICTNKYNPCFLMSEVGIREFQKELSKNLKYRRQSFLETKTLTKRLQQALREMKLVEGLETKNVLERLKKKGCWVFALTARYAEMANSTNKMLSDLGIDFAATAPFPRGSQMRDPQTGAVCTDGIIYSSALDKGMVLNRFLENVVFRKHLQALNVARPLAPSQRANLPPKLVFVDDRVENVESVASGLSVCAGSCLDIPVWSLYYAPSPAVASPVHCSRARSHSFSTGVPIKWMDVDTLKQLIETNPTANCSVPPGHLLGETQLAILRVQVEHFVCTEKILNNFEAESGNHNRTLEGKLDVCRNSEKLEIDPNSEKLEIDFK